MNRHSLYRSVMAMIPAGFLVLGACANQDRGQAVPPESGEPALQPSFDEQPMQESEPGIGTDVHEGTDASESPGMGEPQTEAQGPSAFGGQDNPMSGVEPGAQTEAQGPGATGDMAANLQPGEIVAVAMAVDQGELELATMAREKLTNEQVKSLAADIIKHHQSSLQKYRQMGQRQNIEPQSNPVAQNLQQQVQQARDQLTGLSGAEFDRQFLQINVRLHQDAQRQLRDQLIPAAQNPRLKSQLQKQEKLVTKHLERAQKLQQQLQQGGDQS